MNSMIALDFLLCCRDSERRKLMKAKLFVLAVTVTAFALMLAAVVPCPIRGY